MAKRLTVLLRNKGKRDYATSVIKSSLFDFKQLLDQLTPHIERAERVRNLRKGHLTLSRFLELFSDEADRQVLINQIVDDIERGQTEVSKNLLDIIASGAWEPIAATIVLERCLLGMERFLREKESKTDETYLMELFVPFIYRMATFCDGAPLALALHHNFFGQLIVASMTPDRMNGICTLFANNDSDAIMDSLLKGSHNAVGKNNARAFLLRWVELDVNLTAEKKVLVLSKWLTAHQVPSVSGEPLAEIQVILHLRDLLVDQGRFAEALTLVAGLWRSSGDDQVLDGFEDGFYSALSQLIERGEEGKSLVHGLLQNPKWLVQSIDGVLVYLYLCYLGKFEDLVESGHYNYFNEFRETVQKHPVLVEECLLQKRGVQNRHEEHATGGFDANVISVRQVIEGFEHGLLRLSSYKDWHPAADYQRFFNKRLTDLREAVFHCEKAKIDEIDQRLQMNDPHKWILDADKELGLEAQHRAHESMEKYIQEQTDRLSTLLGFRKQIKGVDFERYLEYAGTTLRSRLANEIACLTNCASSMLSMP